MQISLISPLFRAIALSMQEATVSETKPKAHTPARDVIEILSSDDEDPLKDEEAKFQAELQKALNASKAEVKPVDVKPENSEKPTKTEPGTSNPPPSVPTTVPQSGFPFDRAQLERERLARLKRLRPEQTNTDPGSQVKDERSAGETGNNRDSKRQRVLHPSSTVHRSDVSSSSRTSTSAAPSASGSAKKASNHNFYWDGELRQTANMHVDKLKDTRPVFTLTDTLAPVKDTLLLSFMSMLIPHLSI